jgi:hypothetical protein
MYWTKLGKSRKNFCTQGHREWFDKYLQPSAAAAPAAAQ